MKPLSFAEDGLIFSRRRKIVDEGLEIADSSQGVASNSPQGHAFDLPQGPASDSPQGHAFDSPQGPASDSPQGHAFDSPQGPASDSPQGPASESIEEEQLVHRTRHQAMVRESVESNLQSSEDLDSHRLSRSVELSSSPPLMRHLDDFERRAPFLSMEPPGYMQMPLSSSLPPHGPRYMNLPRPSPPPSSFSSYPRGYIEPPRRFPSSSEPIRPWEGNSDRETQTPDAEEEVDAGEGEWPIVRPKGSCDYPKALQNSLVVTAAATYHHAREVAHALAESLGQDSWRIVAANCLWSMPSHVLQLLTTGNLSSAYWDRSRGYNHIQDVFVPVSDWMKEASSDAPVIYAVLVTNRRDGGKSPTPAELQQVIVQMRRYARTEPDFINESLAIDNAFRRNGSKSTRIEVASGRAFWLCKRVGGRRVRVGGRTEIIIQFCDALEKRLGKLTAAEQKLPLTHALLYIGYALNFNLRRTEHEKGESNFLMHLVVCVCQTLFPGRYELDAYPVCFLAVETEVKCAELSLALIADSFASTGGGFNIATPGGSNASAANFGAEFWMKRLDFRLNMSYWKTNRAAESRILEEMWGKKANGDGTPAPSTQQATLLSAKEELEAAEIKVHNSEVKLLAGIAIVVEQLKAEEGWRLADKRSIKRIAAFTEKEE
jgi:hypothetical protein